MSRDNPSLTLTMAEVDCAVDLIMKGKKYCSPKELQRFPSPKVAMQLCLGTRNWNAAQTYVSQRWGMAGPGLTRRTNTLSQKVSAIANLLTDDVDIVWKAGYWRGTIGFVSAANKEAARELAWTMFAWSHESLSNGKNNKNDLYIEKISAGGWREAAMSNVGLVNTLNTNVSESERQIRELQATIGKYRDRIAGLQQAIMMCGPEGVAEEQVQDAEEKEG